MLTRERLESMLQNFPRLKLGLIGDLFLDRYLELAPGVVEMSIETGLEAYQIPVIRNAPGAMGTVLNNLAALGVGQLLPVTVIGDDGQGYDLLKELRRLPVDPSSILTDPQRLTPTYTKPMKQRETGEWVELNRLDLRTRGPLSTETTERVCQQLRSVFEAADGLIVLDQINETNWGVVNEAVRNTLHELQRDRPEKLVYIDSRRHLQCFQRGTLKGNRAEVLTAAGITVDSDAAVSRALQQLAARTGSPCFCTLGAQGILVARPHQDSPERTAAPPVTGPIDIVGAGDAATSGIVTSLLSGATHEEAAWVGNLVASITIQQLGTTGTASPDQVRARYREVAT